MSARSTGGFTLLEVLVALVIAALAFVVLFQAGGGGLVSVATASRADEALERAQSHLAAVGRDVALLQGASSGDDGSGYRWSLRVTPVASRRLSGQNFGPGPEAALFDVEVTISWEAGGHRRAVVLRSLRVATTIAATQ